MSRMSLWLHAEQCSVPLFKPIIAMLRIKLNQLLASFSNMSQPGEHKMQAPRCCCYAKCVNENESARCERCWLKRPLAKTASYFAGGNDPKLAKRVHTE